jgi:hypothetical protein
LLPAQKFKTIVTYKIIQVKLMKAEETWYLAQYWSRKTHQCWRHPVTSANCDSCGKQLWSHLLSVRHFISLPQLIQATLLTEPQPISCLLHIISQT